MLAEAARANDVNLIILHTDAGRQPGSLSWLWQRMEVGGMAEASKGATYGDFLDALGEQRGGFELSGSADGAGRVHFTMTPAQAGSLPEAASSYLENAVEHVTGEIVTKGVDVYTPDEQTQSEYDARIIPGVPTHIQFPYLASLFAGILAWSTARGWWHRVWPAPASSDPGGRLLRGLKRVPKEVVYWIGFLPAVGLPALIVQTILQFWLTVTAPFRWLYRHFLRRGSKAGLTPARQVSKLAY